MAFVQRRRQLKSQTAPRIRGRGIFRRLRCRRSSDRRSESAQKNSDSPPPPIAIRLGTPIFFRWNGADAVDGNYTGRRNRRADPTSPANEVHFFFFHAHTTSPDWRFLFRRQTTGTRRASSTLYKTQSIHTPKSTRTLASLTVPLSTIGPRTPPNTRQLVPTYTFVAGISKNQEFPLPGHFCVFQNAGISKNMTQPVAELGGGLGGL